MIYKDTLYAIFIERKNRFIAHVLINNEIYVCHVKNTGRCHELLIPGVTVIVQKVSSPRRKTCFDLIAVWKGERLINIDSSAPNHVFFEWLSKYGLDHDAPIIRSEVKCGDSRFDFQLNSPAGTTYIEVKGVTLEDNGMARFPDAPTQRGIKHLYGLSQLAKSGFGAYMIFVVQFNGARSVAPNWSIHPEFGLALRMACDSGVKILAFDCLVTENSLSINAAVPVIGIYP